MLTRLASNSHRSACFCIIMLELKECAIHLPCLCALIGLLRQLIVKLLFERCMFIAGILLCFCCLCSWTYSVLYEIMVSFFFNFLHSLNYAYSSLYSKVFLPTFFQHWFMGMNFLAVCITRRFLSPFIMTVFLCAVVQTSRFGLLEIEMHCSRLFWHSKCSLSNQR